MSIKVLIVDDHAIIRTSLRALLEQKSGITVIGEAANGQEAITLAQQLTPDVILMDVQLRHSEITGLMATQKITEANAKIKVIALSVEDDVSYVKRMLSAGACGYLFKGCTEDELMSAIYTTLDGKPYLSKEIVTAVSEDYIGMLRHQGDKRNSNLSVREREILHRIASGHASKQIATDLEISHKTVDAHKRHIMEKLNIWSIAELTQYAIREGIISDDKKL